jgi:SNF2 family DNA or RNA helicase
MFLVNSQLRDFQAKTVSWMNEKEKNDGGGLLLNDPGTGKTLCCLKLILSKYNGGKTLILCPAGLISNWVSEIKKHTNLVDENILVYSGKDRKEKKISDKNVVVISSYSLITRELNEVGFVDDCIFKMNYERIILDEGHYIRNWKRKLFAGVMLLNARLKWVVTATPIFNSVEDIYAYMRFLDLIGDRSDWRNLFSQKFGIKSYKELNNMIGKNSLRFKKSDVLKDLKKKREVVVSLDLEDFEKEFYESLWEYSLKRMKNLSVKLKRLSGLSDMDSKMLRKLVSNNILVYILRLKQSCNNPWLVISKMDRLGNVKSLKVATERLKYYNSSMNMEEECPVCYDNIADGIATPCGHKCCMGCWDKLMEYTESCPQCRSVIDGIDKVELVKVRELNDVNVDMEVELKDSSKVKKLLEIIREKRLLGEKVVVVSQWVKMLDIVKEMVSKKIPDIKSVTLQGDVSLKNREKNIMMFQEDKSVELCYVSLMSSAEGINLTSANNMILLDNWWNKSKMLQVSDRVHRIGQMREVNIYKLRVGGENSIEERIDKLISKKEKLKNLILKNWDINDMDNYDDDWIKDPIKLIN